MPGYSFDVKSVSGSVLAEPRDRRRRLVRRALQDRPRVPARGAGERRCDGGVHSRAGSHRGAGPESEQAPQGRPPSARPRLLRRSGDAAAGRRRLATGHQVLPARRAPPRERDAARSHRSEQALHLDDVDSAGAVGAHRDAQRGSRTDAAERRLYRWAHVPAGDDQAGHGPIDQPRDRGHVRSLREGDRRVGLRLLDDR